MNHSVIRTLVALCLGALLVSSCSNPEKEKLQHLQLGDKYAAEKRDEFAVVEYANAVKIDPKFGEARLKLAQTYERLNNLPASFQEYIRAADALPADRQLQLKTTQLLLLAGQFDDAKARAAALLATNPQDVEALLLHAAALSSQRDPAGAIAQIEEALKISPDSSSALLGLGTVRMQSGEAKEAEAAFRKAVALAPSSVVAKLHLVNFLWSSGRAPEAEATLKEIIGKEPQHPLANRMLGSMYVATGRTKEAEVPFKVLADSSKTPDARFQLADYYVSVGRTRDAANVLTPLAADPATFTEAELRLAILDYIGGRVPEAHKRLDVVLGRVVNRGPALILKTRWLTTENKLDEALETAKAAVAASPEAAEAHFALAAVQERRRDVAGATKSYNEVLRLNPRVTAAQVALSRMSLGSGAGAAALRYAEEARVASPTDLAARVVLARSLIAARDWPRAEAEVAGLLKAASTAPVVHTVNGMLQADRGNAVAARSSFERALTLSPGFPEALAGLTYLDLTGKNPAAAIARLEAESARKPDSAPLLGLLARAYTAAGDPAKAEQALRRAVSVDPTFKPGYAMLGQLYVKQKRIEEARVEFEGIAKRDPADIGARTMVGMLFEAQGKREEARKSYEATVNGPGNAPVAANNLAFIYAELGTNLDVALGLATSAKQGLPDDPSVDDTLGWIYYKKDQPSLAVKPLEESVSKRPDGAETLYHLGMTYAKLGEKAKARQALERALKLEPGIGGDEARRALVAVSQ